MYPSIIIEWFPLDIYPSGWMTCTSVFPWLKAISILSWFSEAYFNFNLLSSGNETLAWKKLLWSFISIPEKSKYPSFDVSTEDVPLNLSVSKNLIGSVIKYPCSSRTLTSIGLTFLILILSNFFSDLSELPLSTTRCESL